MHAVLRPRFREILFRPLDLPLPELRSMLRELALDVEVRVPDGEIRHGGELPHRLAVFADRRADDTLTLLRGVAILTSGDGKAGGQPLDVPLPWPG